MQNSADLLEQVKNPDIGSNAHTLEQFVTGSLHNDYQNEIFARIEQMRDYNENNESKQYLETRGGIKALRESLEIFVLMLANKQDDNRRKEEERNG